MLLGVAAFHKRALHITLTGLAVIILYEAFVTAFPTAAAPEPFFSISSMSG
jgi:hypothetical protein